MAGTRLELITHSGVLYHVPPILSLSTASLGSVQARLGPALGGLPIQKKE